MTRFVQVSAPATVAQASLLFVTLVCAILLSGCSSDERPFLIPTPAPTGTRAGVTASPSRSPTRAMPPTSTPLPPLSPAPRTPTAPLFQATPTQTRVPTTTPPPPNPAYPLVNIYVQAIQVSDNNGGRAARITPDQVRQWVDRANEVWAGASIRLLYNPQSDFATIRNTRINNLVARWGGEQAVDTWQANDIAGRYPGKLAIFFGYGLWQDPFDHPLSGSGRNYIGEIGYYDVPECGGQNREQLAHDFGHYLGLRHTYSRPFHSLQEAQSYLQTKGGDFRIFDGDGLSDTEPDPFIDDYTFKCQYIQSLVLNGLEVPLPRKNIMSNYAFRTELSSQQINLARRVLDLRLRNGLAAPRNSGVSGAIEFESLRIKSVADLQAQVQDMTRWRPGEWSGHKQLACMGKDSGTITFDLPIWTSRSYALDLYATMAFDFAQVQVLLDGQPLGAPIDLYFPNVIPSGRIPVGSFYFTAGMHELGFRAAGKNPASLGFTFGLDAYTLTPQ